MKKFKWSQYKNIDNEWYAYYGNEELGFIEWYPKWKKYVWNQGEDIILLVVEVGFFNPKVSPNWLKNHTFVVELY